MRTLPLPLLLLLAATAAAAQAPTPEQTVALLLSAPHGLSPLSGTEVAEAAEAVRKDPGPYLPHLLAPLSAERILATEDDEALRRTANAAALLVILGGEEGRAAVAERLRALQRSRDEHTARKDTRLRTLKGQSAARQQRELRKLESPIRRLRRVEQVAITAFASAGDPRLQDTLLPRVASEPELQVTYLDYLQATGRDDPKVRAHLQRLLDTPGESDLKPRLRQLLAPTP
jgi:hypothetical protein